MLNFIKADLAKVGINVITVPVDFNTLITNLRTDFQYDAMLLGLQSGVPPDPSMMQNVWRSARDHALVVLRRTSRTRRRKRASIS